MHICKSLAFERFERKRFMRCSRDLGEVTLNHAGVSTSAELLPRRASHSMPTSAKQHLPQQIPQRKLARRAVSMLVVVVYCLHEPIGSPE